MRFVKYKTPVQVVYGVEFKSGRYMSISFTNYKIVKHV